MVERNGLSESPVLDRYVVMGNPIGHSKSPRIHTLFAAQTGQAMRYEAMLVPLDGFAQSLARFQQDGGKGANVTVPFKEEAWRSVSTRGALAERAGAVNTITLLPDGTRRGDNTDGIGLLRDLTQNLHVSLASSRVLLLGAGGAVRGVLEPLLASNPACLVIANRTAEKAIALARDFAAWGEVRGGGFGELAGQTFDVIINGTAASLHGELPPVPDSALANPCTCYDMMYGAEPTAFMTWAARHPGARVFDGLGMLVEQAAEAFFLWRGVRPDTTPVIAQLRRDLAGG